MGHSALLYQVSSYTAKLWILAGHKRTAGVESPCDHGNFSSQLEKYHYFIKSSGYEVLHFLSHLTTLMYNKLKQFTSILSYLFF